MELHESSSVFSCMAVCIKWNELWGSEAIILASLIESSEAQAVVGVQGRVRSILLRCSTYTKMLSYHPKAPWDVMGCQNHLF